ncbi:S1 RNA-binding domain-containing protein [Motiliproteus sp. SC1-56]|uniref:CvfB family protein n=1 Tax=Motiliproteus sp. SC1-56 TaxID=2799565 RepID=UPI001A8C6E1F|nr:S1-like domain-containing RNA-binding protein [Motiliproteus sp. SC1-56]
MTSIGTFNTLPVVKERAFGLYLDAGPLGEVLLPQRYVPAGTQVGDQLEVFIYLDSEDCPIATTERPAAQVGEFAYLPVVSKGPVGAFLGWGLSKDLLLPFAEQKGRVEAGGHCLVRIYLDNSNRLAASMRWNRYLDQTPPRYHAHQPVDLIIAQRTELGYKAIVNHRHWGLIHHSDVQRPLHTGQSLSGYIKRQRPDGKLDLVLRQPGFAEVKQLTETIIEALEEAGGYLPCNDRSDPAEIRQRFDTSKKQFKSALGVLYRQRRISLESDGIRLNPDLS